MGKEFEAKYSNVPPIVHEITIFEHVLISYEGLETGCDSSASKEVMVGLKSFISNGEHVLTYMNIHIIEVELCLQSDFFSFLHKY